MKRPAQFAFVLAIAGMWLGSVPAAMAVTVVNGGFSGACPTDTGGGCVPDGWSANSVYVDHNYNVVVPDVGAASGFALRISNNENQNVPVLSQVLTDTAGTDYTLSFDARSDSSDAGSFLDVFVNGAGSTITGTLASYTLESFNFVGTGSDTLDISALNSPGFYFVTDVSVAAVGVTPLPAALPLFASGLGAMGLFGWRRKRKNAAAIAAA